jgi:hypothetical protein
VEEFQPDRLLQTAYLLRDRGLGDPERARSLVDTLVAHHLVKCSQRNQ